ncbi:GNAT family N-acetyltransferase [Amycolatopsis sp. NPDC059021]|uniref:GNAT family N-acetyltransferase n=1 Tax=Amycolatopsis sp. NPDC059021 TaxID=3346704 RepID=UPI00366EBC23
MLSGKLVRLRPLEPSDAESLYRWNSDPDIGRWMVNSHPLSLAQFRKRCEERKENSYDNVVLGIETLAEGKFIGIIDLRDAEPEIGNADLDLYIGEKDHWGKGYATDAMRVMCAYGFNSMRLHLISLRVVAENEAARHVYRKVGFHEDGRHREAFRGDDGKRYDMILMSLINGELT